VEPYLNCGTCIACRRGKPNCCVQLRVLGVHADMREFLVVPAAKGNGGSIRAWFGLLLIR
jgi:threonine dehydrogenase-like Zn-dependent dehydrogenase